MTAPQWNRQTQYYPPVLAPDIEWLAQAFFTPLLTVPIATRLPQPAAMAASFPAILRVESGNVDPCMDVYGTAWNASFLMHSYSIDEIEASEVSRNALAYAISTAGTSILGWYVIRVVNVVGSRRLDDPDVPLNVVRYRSAITWRIAGQQATIQQ